MDRAARAMGKSRSAWVEDALREVLSGSDDIVRVMADRTVRTAMLDALAKPGVIQAMASAMSADLDEAKVQQVLGFMKDAGSGKRPARR